MTKLFKKIVSLILGVIIGIVAVSGALVASAYYLYTRVTVGDMTENRYKDSLGDVNEFSIADLVNYTLAARLAPENYTFKDMRDSLRFDIVALINALGGDGSEVIKSGEDGKNEPYVDDLRSVSLFTLLSSDGFKKFFEDLPAGAVLSFIDPEIALDYGARARLRSYTLGDLIKKDGETGFSGYISALSEVSVGSVLSSLFTKDENGDYAVKDGLNPAFNLLANVEFGAILNILKGNYDIGAEIVEGGLKTLGNTPFTEIVKTLGFGENIAEIVGSALSDIKFKDLFSKDLSTGRYAFSLDALLENVGVGAFFGFSCDAETGKWYSSYGGEKTEVRGLLAVLASLNAKDLYHAFADGGDAFGKVRSALLTVGDLTIGDILITSGFEKGDDGAWYFGGSPVFNSPVIDVILSVPLKATIAEREGENFGFELIRKNLFLYCAAHSGDLTLGDGFAELFGADKTDDGYVFTSGENEGIKVNPVISDLFGIKASDLFAALGGEKFTYKEMLAAVAAAYVAYSAGTGLDYDDILDVLDDALSTRKLGVLFGGTETDGVWYDADGNRIDGFNAVYYGISFSGVIRAMESLGKEDFSLGAVARNILPDTRLGELFAGYLGYTADENGIYLNSDGKEASSGLQRLFGIKVWELAAGFDPADGFDITEDFSAIRIGDLFDFTFDDGAVKCWYTGASDRYVYGKLGEILSYTLADLLASEGNRLNDIYEKIYEARLGDIVALAVEDKTFSKILDKLHADIEIFGYEYAASGDFNEVLNVTFNLTVSEIAAGAGNLLGFVLDNYGDMPLGNFLGYLFNRGMIKNQLGISEIKHEGGGWEVVGPYEHPLTILFDDLTLRKLYDGRSDVKGNIVKGYFGDVYLGEFLGARKIGGVWYKADGEPMETHGANSVITNAVYSLTVEQVIDENFDFSTVINDVYLGELMNYYRCEEVGGEIACDIEEHGTHLLGGWYKKEGDEYKKVGAIENAVSGVTVGEMTSGSFSFADALGGVKVGEVMEYTYSGGVWYDKDGKRADKLQSIVADIDMGEVAGGSFDLNDKLEEVKLGEVMGYRYCGIYRTVDTSSEKYIVCTEDGHTDDLIDGDGTPYHIHINECDAFDDEGSHADQITPPSPHENGWYKKKAGVWEKTEDNIVLAIADFTIKDLNREGFTDELLAKIKTTVKVKDIFPAADGTPLALIDPETPIGEVSSAMTDAIDDATVRELIDCGVMKENMFADGTPLALLKNYKKADNEAQWIADHAGEVPVPPYDGLSYVKLSELADAVTECIEDAKLGELVDNGILPTSATTMANSFGNIYDLIVTPVVDPISGTSTRDRFRSDVVAAADYAAANAATGGTPAEQRENAVDYFWRNLNVDQMISCLGV